MTNLGIAPLNPSTPVGQLRVNLGDKSFKPLDPPIPGAGDYANFSDADLTALLAGAAGSVSRATGAGYMQLAAVYIATGRSIKTDDLAIDTRQRGKDLFEVAKWWFTHADEADAAGVGDIFMVAPFGGRPEGTPRPLTFEPELPTSELTFTPDPQNPGYLHA
jgi:hypothetical protein